MPRVGFEPTIPVFERAKTFHALDRANTVIGRKNSWGYRTGKNSALVPTPRVILYIYQYILRDSSKGNHGTSLCHKRRLKPSDFANINLTQNCWTMPVCLIQIKKYILFQYKNITLMRILYNEEWIHHLFPWASNEVWLPSYVAIFTMECGTLP
jgi:hypothetical protein